MLVEYFLSREFGREFDSPHLHKIKLSFEELRVNNEQEKSLALENNNP